MLFSMVVYVRNPSLLSLSGAQPEEEEVFADVLSGGDLQESDRPSSYDRGSNDLERGGNQGNQGGNGRKNDIIHKQY